jgi:hypothetical protein
MSADATHGGVVQNRRQSQICRLGRVAGYGIIGDGERIVPIFIDRGAPGFHPSLRNGNALSPLNAADFPMRAVKPLK